jgi:hypothetical protein
MIEEHRDGRPMELWQGARLVRAFGAVELG